MKIVIVDDDLDVRRAVASLLRSHGHDVQVFESAEDYLARYAAADCALFDIALPGMSGLDLYERLREQGIGIPVVFITAHSAPSLMDAVQSTGQPLLKKPLDEDIILEAIARAGGNRS